MAPVQPPGHIQALTESSDVFRRVIRCFRFQQGIRTYSDLAVSQTGTPSMAVSVAAGECIIDGVTNTVYQGSYHCMNDAAVTVSIAPSDPTNPRISLIVAEVLDAQYSGASNLWQIVEVAGTPASSPAVPSTSGRNVLVLAQVRVNANATSITNANITDQRVQFNSNPYKARAYASGTVVCAPSVYTVIPLDTASFDPSGAFSSANHNFSAPVPGNYQVNGRTALIDNANTVQNFLVSIFKNGTENSRGVTMRDGSATGQASYGGSVSDVIPLNAGDTISMRVFHTSTNGCSSETGSVSSFMSFILIST